MFVCDCKTLFKYLLFDVKQPTINQTSLKLYRYQTIDAM